MDDAKTILLRARILALIENHPEILTMPSASDLLTMPAFEFIDINPTLVEVYDALIAARRIWKEQQPQSLRADEPVDYGLFRPDNRL